MEELVEERLDEVIGELGCCNCNQCRNDILSYALNRLSPKYVNSEFGKAMVKLDTMSYQFDIDILTALYDGASLVKLHPHHPVEAKVHP